MFGAADPEQAISQLEAYYREGRGERAEVMASALVDQLIALKDRDDDTWLLYTSDDNQCIYWNKMCKVSID